MSHCSYKNIFLVVISTFFIIVLLKTNNLSNENLNKDNDSLKLEIKNLETIKDAKVIEVSQLDNDSTIKLFYKLVKE